MQKRHRNDMEDWEARGSTYMPARMKDWEDQGGFIWTHMALFAVSTHIDTIVGWIFEYMLRSV
jgi:hypothetical protein